MEDALCSFKSALIRVLQVVENFNLNSPMNARNRPTDLHPVYRLSWRTGTRRMSLRLSILFNSYADEH